MKKELVDGTDKKSIVINILFTLTVSIVAIMFDKSNLFWASFMGGWATAPDDKIFEGLLVSVAFLVVWLFYGMVMGYMKKKSFIKFISLYWGISGSIYLLALLMAPIGKLAIVAIPVLLLSLAPTYGLEYFMHLGSHKLLYGVMCITLSWSSGAIGYLLGYLLKKLRVSMLSDK